MKDIFIWIIIWYSVWGFWEAVVHKMILKLSGNRHVLSGIFFTICFIYVYLHYYEFLSNYSRSLGTALAIVSIINFIISSSKKLRPANVADEYNLTFQTFCILFQQSMVVVSIQLLKRYFGTNYNDIYYGVLFFLVHSPILFIKWNKLRNLYLFLSFFGGIFFSYLINNYEYGLIFSFIIHFSLYIWTIPGYHKIAQTFTK